MNYSDLLKNPKWQKKRLEILSRDNFKCVKCGQENKMLNVHHFHYLRDRKPWEYDDINLVALCEECHKFVHEFKINIIDFYKSIDIKDFFGVDLKYKDLRCPVCFDYNIHIKSGINTELEIKFWCESGHSWVVKFIEDHGKVRLEIEKLKGVIV